jgi:hypothetical protein
MAMPLVREKQLREELTEQGFRIEDDSDGFTVYGVGKELATDPDGIVRIHTSSMGKEGHPIKSILTQLRRIGYKPSRGVSSAASMSDIARNQVAITCRIDGCTFTGRPGPTAMHRKAKHPQWWAEQHPTEEKVDTEDIELPPVVRRRVKVTRQEPRSKAVKAKYLTDRIREASIVVSNSLEELVDMVTSLEDDNDEMRSRLKKLEDIFGKAVDVL